MDGILSTFLNARSGDYAELGNGILYIEDFDAAQQPASELPAPAPAPSFTESDLHEAREAGRHSGLAEAREEHASLVADLQLAAVQSIADAALNARAHVERIAQHRAEELSLTILAILVAALPAAMSAQGSGEIEAIVQALLPAMRSEPEITVRSHPEQAAFLTALLGKSLEANKTALIVHHDDAIDAGSVVFEWRDGGARRDCDAIWKQITKALEPLQIKNLKDILNGC